MSDTTKIAETSRRGLEAVNLKLAGQYNQLTDLLARRLGPDHAFLFAEPVALGGSGGSGRDTAWFVPGIEPARPLSDIDEAEAAPIRAKLARLIQDINGLAGALEREGEASKELARLLRDALVIPDASCVWAVGDRPVLVDWGFRKIAEAGSSRDALGVLVATGGIPGDREKPVSPGRAAAPAGTAFEQPGRAMTQPEPTGRDPADRRPAPPGIMPAPLRRRSRPILPAGPRFAGALLWLLFVVLLVAISDLLLEACAVGGAWHGFIRAWLPDRCPALLAASPEIVSARAAARQIEAEIHDREIALARKIASCDSCRVPAPAAAAAPTPIAPAQHAAAEPVAPPTAEQVEGRLQSVQRGRYELTLAWDGSSDLDLHVACPGGGHIAFNSKSACGGQLVADLNANGGRDDSHPIEHIIWNESPRPEGRYTVSVSLYARHRDGRERIPYVVMLQKDGQIITKHDGAATAERGRDAVFTFNSPLER
jgi:hypothetical protein